MPFSVLIVFALRNEHFHVLVTNRDILNCQSANFIYTKKTSKANQEDKKKTNYGKRTTKNIMISDP